MLRTIPFRVGLDGADDMKPVSVSIGVRRHRLNLLHPFLGGFHSHFSERLSVTSSRCFRPRRTYALDQFQMTARSSSETCLNQDSTASRLQFLPMSKSGVLSFGDSTRAFLFTTSPEIFDQQSGHREPRRFGLPQWMQVVIPSSSGLARRSGRSICVVLWLYHDAVVP